MNNTSRASRTRMLAKGLLAACLLAILPCPSWAALTSISSDPLPTLVASGAKPNILFILDNSGSMGLDYMPDDASDTTTYGYKSAQCNGVAYDPTFNYVPPLKANGTSYPDANFSAAAPNGFGPTPSAGKAYHSDSTVTTGLGTKSFAFTSGFLAGLFNGFNFLAGVPNWAVGDLVTAIDSGDDNHWVIGTITNISTSGICVFPFSCTRTVTINVTSFSGTDAASDWKVNKLQLDNLANSTYYTYNSNGSQPKMGWTYTATGSVNSTFKAECNSHPATDPNEPGDNKFTGVTVTAASAEAQRYANWYQYYRTRMLMMRTAAGRAFQPLSDQYRIGFSTINNTGITESSTLSVISAGNAFLNVRDYDSTQRGLFMERLYSATPKGGTPLRGALSKAGMYFAKKVPDQSYDPMQYVCQRNYAFLSTDGYWNDNSNPKQLNNSTDIGQQDGSDVLPFNDGASSTSTTVTTVVERKQTTTPVTVSQNYAQNKLAYPSGGCFLSHMETKTPQTATTSASGFQVVTTDWTTKTTVAVTNTGGAVSTNTSTVTTSNQVSSTGPTPPSAPAAASSAWVSGATTNTCVFSNSAAGASPVGGVATTVTGPVVTATLSTTTTVAPSTVTTSGGVSNTLADVAEYYYRTDLRTSALDNCTGALGVGTDVCDNSKLTAAGRDTATWQHMSTFTLGLGVNGVLAYDKNYLNHATDKSTSYGKLILGKDENNNPYYWPFPTEDKATTVDDLWHAAVNGRGQYFGANNATDLTSGLTGALAGMNNRPGAGSAPAVSDLSPTSTALVFSAKYLSTEWSGDLWAYAIDAKGNVASTPLTGTAQAGVDNLSLRAAGGTDSRVIYYRQPGTTTLRPFTFVNLSADGLGGDFTNFCLKSVSDTATVYPLQCATLDATRAGYANSGANMVAWLRGSYAYEESTASSSLYRMRMHVLGDIVNSEPVYLKTAPFSYTDSGYAAFKTSVEQRKAVVYVGANDGMLHAFSAETSDPSNPLGKELWAFVPTAVMPNMSRLANTDYGNRHQFSVDGSPAIGDIRVGSTWKSILVGGFNSGGKGYYALDITDPASPRMLWEFTQAAVADSTARNVKDPDLGLSYGNPIITKRADGTWVVVFASGYNNTGPGYLYVLNAETGALLLKIRTNNPGTTAVGTAATPSGLAPINAWVDNPTDNTAKRFYGGDLLGNLWRFDIDNLVAPNGAAQRLASFLVGSSASTPQPLTTRPELSYVTYGGVDYPVVFVGTGRYLAATDLTDTTVQSIYGIKDRLTASDWGDVRANGTVVQQTVTTTGKNRSASSNSVNWSSGGVAGWRIDLPDAKERIRVNMAANFGILVAHSTLPGASNCSVTAATGWKYTIDQLTGSNVPGADFGTYLDSAIAGSTYMLIDGKAKLLTTGDDGGLSGGGGGGQPPAGGGGSFKRASWRELISN
ncbi:pilus assembly protein [Aquabacterium sp.]|uniref:pilus assembly protein n=1 Tax=Aquabacterium sp. TaxID=1872578 RepID=UPI003D6D76E2